MTEKEIKRKLEDDGFKVADLARHLAEDFPVAVSSADTMLRELISGRNWFPKYANWMRSNYGIVIEKPKSAQPVRQRMKLAA